MNDEDRIPIVETYRGVGIHDGQPGERIRDVVKPSIDRIHMLGNLHELFAYAGDITQPPEARLFAAAKCQAAFELAVEERRERPDIDLDGLRARTVGLDNQNWRCPEGYCSILDVPPAPGTPGAARREPPLPERGWISPPGRD